MLGLKNLENQKLNYSYDYSTQQIKLAALLQFFSDESLSIIKISKVRCGFAQRTLLVIIND